MTSTLLSTIGALALAATVSAQSPTPATQPVRPPDRPPAGEPTPRQLPPSDEEKVLSGGKGSPEGGDTDLTSARLRGCLDRVDAKSYRLRHLDADESTVTEDVRLEGAVDQLRDLVGRVVEVRGTFEQGTPARTPPFFSVERVREIRASCKESTSPRP